MAKIQYTENDVTLATRKDNAIRESLAKMATSFVSAAKGIYAICLKGADGKHLYRALKDSKGDPLQTQEDYANHLGMGLSDLKSLDRVGRMLSMADSASGWILEVSDAELIACGKASMIELCRLAKNETAFDENMGFIIDLINARASGKITHAVLKDRIDVRLKPEPKGKVTPEGETGETGETGEAPKVPEWKYQLLKGIATAQNPAEALQVAKDVLELFGANGIAEDEADAPNGNVIVMGAAA